MKTTKIDSSVRIPTARRSTAFRNMRPPLLKATIVNRSMTDPKSLQHCLLVKLLLRSDLSNVRSMKLRTDKMKLMVGYAKIDFSGNILQRVDFVAA